MTVVLSKITCSGKDGILLLYYDCEFCDKGRHQHGGGYRRTITDWSKEMSFGDRLTHCLGHKHIANLKYVPGITSLLFT